LENTGVLEAWDTINKYVTLTQENGFFKNRRHDQSRYWMYETINETLRNNFYYNPKIRPKLPAYEKLVLSDGMSSFVAAHELLDTYYKTVAKE